MYTSESDIVGAIQNLTDKRYGDHSCANLKKLLLSYDGNGDGALNRDELSGMLGEAGSCGFLGCDYFANKILDKLDKDGSGTLTWEEYLAVSTSCAAEASATPPPAGGGGGPAPATGPLGLSQLVNKGVDQGALNALKSSTAIADTSVTTVAPAGSDEGLSTGAKVAIGVGAAGLLYFLLK
jgi:hypothetical protein